VSLAVEQGAGNTVDRVREIAEAVLQRVGREAE
jgi:hypothetical protein